MIKLDERYETLQNEIAEMLSKFNSKLETHKKDYQENPTWCHLADLEHIQSKLDDLNVFLP
jgi:cell shape-determining protein MreC